jgi:Ca2+-binding RTX toxin-like protein
VLSFGHYHKLLEDIMVVKVLSGGIGGDLNNATDNFGNDNDTVTVAFQTSGFAYSIFTLRGNDIIDLSAANADNDHFIYAGFGNDTVTGGAASDNIYDQRGQDRYSLAGGDDFFNNGKGNDTANGGAGVDRISFFTILSDNGTLIDNLAAVRCDLAETGIQDFGVFGRDRITGFEDVAGGDGDDRLFGTGAKNVFDANAGSDLLNGRGGQDLLEGGPGRDTLIGGGGADTFALYETGAARDTVRILRMSDSGTGTQTGAIDSIAGFRTGGAAGDRIDLSAIDANTEKAGNQAFIFRGAGSFRSDAGEVRIVEIQGNILVRVDIDGDGASEMNILLLGPDSLSASDFIL